MVEAPMCMTWFATGNNVAIAADTARRICHIRLESPEERPENRHNFRQVDLRDFLAKNRASLLAGALTILRAYVVAGRPCQRLAPWGSFEAWSAAVRSVVTWVGLPDPGETRTVLQDQADVSAGAMETLLNGIRGFDADRRGMTAAQLVELAKADDRADLRDAVESLAGRLDARLLGNKLRGFRRRIFGGLYLDRAGEDHRAARWAAFEASEFSARLEKTPHTRDTRQVRGECDESDESFSTGRNCEQAGPYRERF
jgi:hypothetical protein